MTILALNAICSCKNQGQAPLNPFQFWEVKLYCPFIHAIRVITVGDSQSDSPFRFLKGKMQMMMNKLQFHPSWFQVPQATILDSKELSIMVTRKKIYPFKSDSLISVLSCAIFLTRGRHEYLGKPQVSSIVPTTWRNLNIEFWADWRITSNVNNFFDSVNHVTLKISLIMQQF